MAGLPPTGSGFERELAGAGAHEVAAHADVVAEIEEFVEREDVLADVVLADVDLQALAALLQVREAGLALQADGHDAAGDGELGVFGFERLAGDGRGVGVVAREEVGDVREGDVLVGRGEAVGVDALGGGEAEALADGGDLAQFFLALLEQISLEVAFKLAQCGGSLSLNV